MIYTADFETNNSITECRVWSWGLCEVSSRYTYEDGDDLDSFMERLEELSKRRGNSGKPVIWFHNLAFDGEFIVLWLFQNGFAWDNDGRHLDPHHFSTLISDMGQWYTIDICFDKGRTVRIQDSLKILPFSVSEVAKSFGLEEAKGSIDYDTIRPVGYIKTDEEYEYQKIDCLIMAKAIHRMIQEGQTKITAGSNALSHYKSLMSKSKFTNRFPELSDFEDSFIRKSYKGGWVYANPKFKNNPVSDGLVFDVNSLYPSRMKFCMLPYGIPKFFDGEYQEDKYYPLYVQRLTCSFKLKKNHLPMIQLKGHYGYSQTEYVETTRGEIIEMTLTNVDLKLFLEHYEVKHMEYLDGYKFRGATGMFDEYIDYWMSRKIEAERTGDKAGRALAKLMLNSLYGKFAKRPKGKSKIPYEENGILKFKYSEEEDRGKLYIPVGAFITAYARDYTIRAAQKNYDRFAYADTDSIHLVGTEMPTNIDIHKTDLGKWKHEMSFVRAKYLGPKCYCEEEYVGFDELITRWEKNDWELGSWDFDRGTALKVTCSGLPTKLHKYITYDDFNIGLVVHGKLKPKHVQGGKILEKTTFEIKDRSYTLKKSLK